MSEIVPTDKPTQYVADGIHAAVVAIEMNGERYVFVGDILGFDVDYSDPPMFARDYETYRQDLTIHFIGGVQEQTQKT